MKSKIDRVTLSESAILRYALPLFLTLFILGFPIIIFIFIF
jgi:hypothetical protein